MVGSSIHRLMIKSGFKNILVMSSNGLDLRDQAKVNSFLSQSKPDAVILAAARVGGILANDSYPYDFILDNLLIQNNVIHSSFKNSVSKLIFLGSSCIYPKYAKQPIKEEELLTGNLESTNQWYAIAKISGLKLIEALRKQYGKNYISLMPTNLYGPNDNFDLNSSHVLPAMIRKFHDAKINSYDHVVNWGSGKPYREFLHVDDLSEAIKYALINDLPDSTYNIGYGTDISIKDLSSLIKKIVGFKGKVIWDKSKPDGTPKKLIDSSKFNNFGWKPNYSIEDGIKKTYEWYKKNTN